jgi:hypothetical protein
MITFLELGQYGRLGNQLFQYAALKALSLHNQYKIKLPKNLYDRSWHGQKCLLNNFNIDFEFLEEIDFYNLKTYDQYQITGSAQAFDKNFFNLEDNTNLMGFFQNLKYFDFCQNEIKRDLTINAEMQKYCDDYLFEKFKILKKPIVSIHIRRGDNIDYNQSNQNIIDTYVKNCINYFNSEVNFLIFTGGSRQEGENNTQDLEYLKDVYVENNFYYSETNNPMLDFCLMAKCDHNIISHDSTFSWWAAYLNENLDKKVLAPKYSRSLDQTILYEDYYPSDWIIF